MLLNCLFNSQPCFGPLQLLLSRWKSECDSGRSLLYTRVAWDSTGGAAPLWLLLPSRVPHTIPNQLCTPKSPVCLYTTSQGMQHTLAFMLQECHSLDCSMSMCYLAELPPVPMEAFGAVRWHHHVSALAASVGLVSLVSESPGLLERENNLKGTTVSS